LHCIEHSSIIASRVEGKARDLKAKKEIIMNVSAIKSKLLELGCNEWKKAGMHRIYLDGVDAKMLFDNEHARFGKAHKVFFDVMSGEFVCNNESVANNLNSMISE
jgi:hypothetical protein